MSKECTCKLPAETIAKAKERNLYPLIVDDELTAKCEGNEVSDTIGLCIGCVDKDTDTLKSNIKDDDDASKLRAYIDAGIVTTKIFCQRAANNELKNVPHYFIIFDVMESSKQEPTYTESSCGNGTPLNGYYKCRYEVLLGSEEYTRRMVFETESVNISMYSWLSDLMDMIQDGIDERDEDIMQHFNEGEDGEVYFTMYDEIGSGVEIEYDNDEFESMIVGVRQLSCDFVDEKEE